MNERIIKGVLSKKLNNWLDSISDQEVKRIAADNCLVTGGAITSLLLNETPNDYDVYFKTDRACAAVAKYYAKMFNDYKRIKMVVVREVNDTYITADEDEDSSNDIAFRKTVVVKHTTCYIKSRGVAGEDAVYTEYDKAVDEIVNEGKIQEQGNNDEWYKKQYRPVYFSSNAITLSDGVQLIMRFTGSVDEIHKNFDFVHATCSFDRSARKLVLPAAALVAILTKELHYVGSLYPLASIIRTRKFIQRGWKINAGQFVKMAMQLNELNLLDLDVLTDQLTGVDVAYFGQLIDRIRYAEREINSAYIVEIIDTLF